MDSLFGTKVLTGAPERKKDYHDKTIHVMILESENEEDIRKLRQNLTIGNSQVNVLYFRVGDDTLRAILAGLEEAARTRF